MPVERAMQAEKSHQTRWSPYCRIISVTTMGVSEAKLVATMEMPTSHQGRERPPRKKLSELWEARRERMTPTAREKTMYPPMIR